MNPPLLPDTWTAGMIVSEAEGASGYNFFGYLNSILSTLMAHVEKTMNPQGPILIWEVVLSLGCTFRFCVSALVRQES